MQHIKKEDIVEVITGDDGSIPGRRTTGRVLAVYPKQRRVIVEGINRVYKHMRPSRRNPQGGRLSKEMPISISNVLLFCAACRRGVRIGRRYAADGSKERYCKKCGNGLGKLSKARAGYAQGAREAQG
jgi:large subunit ribosomal protein L24